MKIGTRSQLRTVGLIAMLICFGMTGCKSIGSMKMPKMPWNREPSSTTLAGGDTVKLPESPATKYSPNAIASVGGNSTTGGTTTGIKAPTYGSTGQAPSSSTSTAVGLAATANGYQTGPYAVGAGQKPGAAGASPATNNVAAGFPSPYGGSYSGLTSGSGATGAGTKGTFASTGSATSSPYATAQSPYNNPATGSYGNVPPTSFSATGNTVPSAYGSAPTTALPSGYGASPATTPSIMPVAGTSSSSGNEVTYPSLPPIPGATASSVTVGGANSGSTASMPSYPTTNVAQAPAPTATATSTQPTYTGSYQPGTTSRATNYNFGAGSTGGSGSPSYTLPPNTASGAGPGSTNATQPTYR